MGKYTHSKVLTETVDNAVGYIHALVLVSKWDADKATEAAKNRYQLDVITMAVVTLKYRASVVDFVDPTAPKQKAIAQYTLDEIAAHQAEHKSAVPVAKDTVKAEDKTIVSPAIQARVAASTAKKATK